MSNALAGPSNVVAPARSFRILFAVAVTLLMLLSSAALVVGNSYNSHPNRLGTPQASASVLSGALTSQQLQNSPFTTSPGSSALASHTNATDYGPTPLATPMMFTIGFQMRNSQMLEEMLQAQSTPSSPLYHHWLTNDQERTYFGPDPVAYQNTINYFTGLGFKVGTEGLLSVSFSGTTGQVNSAFRTQIDNVGSGQTGAIAPMNAQPLSLPATIATAVSTVNGLDGSQIAHPSSSIDPYVSADVRNGNPSLTPPAAALPGAGPQQNLSTIFNVSNHGFFWVYYYSHSHRAYRTFQVITPGALNDLYNGSQLIDQGINGDSTGNPITIAIVMAGGINPTDMQGYAQLAWNNPNQILSRLFPQPVDGSFTDNGTVPWLDGASSEMALDIEFSSTMAPAAKIMPVYGPCLCTNVLDDDYALLLGQARAPNIISNSWGGDEDRWPNLYGPNWVNALTMHNYFMLLDAKGSTVIASSGDGGGFDTGTGYLSGSFPATDPYVLSINGLRTAATDSSHSPFPTSTKYGIVNISIGSTEQQPFFFGYPVHAGQATHILSQTFWYEPFSNTTLTGAPPQGAGGFDSSYWFNQTWMEHGYTVPDLGRSLGSGVAAEADYNQSIFFDGSMQFFWGGTSFACPTTAGELALIEDYLAHNGHSPYLGNGNGPVYDVANAYLNGNLTLKPFYDVATVPGVSQNGTSYWGNYGVIKGYEFPTAQKFPYDASGNTTYGNTLPGWDFPTGWGSLIVSNFAQDLNILESLPAQFATTNTAGTAYDAGAWDYMQLNHSYTVHVNATGVFASSSPSVMVVFHGLDGTVSQPFKPALTATFNPTSGFDFTLNTGSAPFSQPGFVVMVAGNATASFAGFAYDWISYPVPAGPLTVTVTAPSSPSVLSGFPQFNPWPFGYFAPTLVDPNCCTTPNTFDVHVTLSGQPVYNALVTASVPSLSSLAWQGSRLQAATQSQGNPHELAPSILSSTYTNQLGDAVVYTWNLIQPTVYFVNASIGPNHGGTVYNLTPGLNVKTTDNFGGKYSNFNTIDFVLQNLRQAVNPVTEQLWAPNSLNQTAYYNLMYAWQGEILPLSVNDYAGRAVGGAHVWLGNIDGGGENKFYSYQATGGVVGVTNVSGTANDTGPTGNTSIFIPDNQTDNNFFIYPDGSTAGFAFVAVNMPGQFNRTFSYTEPCAPSNLNNPKSLITCQFNDTLQRNYTAIPTLILGNPINVSTQTTAKIARDFFGSGSNISWHVNFLLPTADPFITGFGYYWLPGTEHVVSVRAYVDGAPAGDLSPATPPQWQNYTANGNLTGTYAPGIHDLRVVATDSLGHVFTRDHTFVVGGINVTNLGIKNTYTVLPYTLNWTYILPPGQVNNHTFSQSVEVRYVAPGCGGSVKCPQLVNLTLKIRPGVVDYNQSLNITMLNTNHFYSGTQLPQGQYQVIVWLNANHSGSIAAQINTQIVFENVAGQINGPSDGAIVPLGNVTISYSYSGEFIENATLFVFPAGGTAPVFQAGAFVPGINGLRGGAATWTAVTPGLYQVVLALGTPYGGYNATTMVNVSHMGGNAILNASAGGVLGGMSPAVVGTALAVIAGIVGLFLGLMLAPSLRQGAPRAVGGPSAKAAPKPWQEEPAASTKQVCSICHEEFETPFALHQHQKITHGIEE